MIGAVRLRVLQCFLWLSVLSCGIGLGAKLFDLIVVAGAWSASPPASFGLLPYGPRYPIDPGDFFIPLSAIIVVGNFGALVAGWRSPRRLRTWLFIPAVMFVITWAVTPTVFWPMIRQLYGTATGKLTTTDAEAIQLARRWLIWDSIRVGLIAVSFVASIKALVLSATILSSTSTPERSGTSEMR
jgi:hypothetical protein